MFLGVAALVGASSFIMRGDSEAEVEERLERAHRQARRPTARPTRLNTKSCSPRMRSDGTGAVEKFVSRYLNLRLLFEQANVSMPVPKFLIDLRRPRPCVGLVAADRRPDSA